MARIGGTSFVGEQIVARPLLIELPTVPHDGENADERRRDGLCERNFGRHHFMGGRTWCLLKGLDFRREPVPPVFLEGRIGCVHRYTHSGICGAMLLDQSKDRIRLGSYSEGRNGHGGRGGDAGQDGAA
jgi:hypothetical protein